MSEPRDETESEDSLIAKQEFFQLFLESQQQDREIKSKELQIRSEELELEKQKDDHTFEFSKLSLSVQKEDRADDRKHRSGLQKNVLLFVTVIAVLLVAIIIISIINNQIDLAKEVIKAVAYIGAGSFGGYGFGRYKKSSQDSDNSD